MSLADDKRNVFTTIGAYTSFMEQKKPPRRGELYPSINNKKDAVPFLLDVLKTIAGSEALKELIGGMFGDLIDDSETKMKTALKKQFILPNSDDQISTDFSTNGVDIPVKDIDVTGKLKINPYSDSGKMLFDTTTPNFDKVAYDAILNAGTVQTFGGVEIKYNELTDNFNFKPVDANMRVGEFFSDYIDNAQIINKDELLTKVMDKVYGTLSKENGRTQEQILQELEIDKMLDQALDEDGSFVIQSSDLNDLINTANQISKGVVEYDLGCGLMSTSLSFDSLKNLINDFSSGSTDPFYVGNIVENTINESTSEVNQATTDENKATIKDGFFQKIIKFFTTKLLFFLTTAPQIRMLLGISSSFQNNGVVSIESPSVDFKKFKTFILCLAKEILKIVAAFIFALAIGKLIELLKPVIKKIIKEKVNQYVKIIKSLTPASKFVNSA